MKCLRSFELPDLTPAVLRLLTKPDQDVQLTALEALTNLALDTASVKVRFLHSLR